ncbi:helix-turn-helix domain-containing protein [Heyndrickxia oleronia]|uniref:helix-turn-helix domain-containing protein n=1 Tax=Heyndrickxia oleronia TaxID=38875 RepID=UPI001C0F3287|nr:helix-turn-helix transcriptional regulator [Heyndrickxia oleronia]MBU5211049.1 helix-turn-helix transcriptional regulator [Heyndrickxia oleronia]
MGRTIEVKLRKILTDRKIDQKQLANMSGLTERTVSELVNNKTKRYPKEALESIANALNINDINEILTIVDEESADQ